MFSVFYRQKTAPAVTIPSHNGSFPTLEAARAAAAQFYRTNGLAWDVWIYRPYLKVSMKPDPLIESPVEFDRDGNVKA
jgi:hypothetical protein